MSEGWSGRTGFILASVAAAVGLGSIWKFPYEAGANGGGAFVLFYFAGLLLAVVPLMLAEFAMGRAGGCDAAGSIAKLAAAHGASPAWKSAGVLGVAAGALILSFYSVIGGWTLAYAVQPGRDYHALLGSPASMIAYHAVFMALCAAVVARGVSRGIEAAARILMPVLVLLMLALALYSSLQGDLAATLRFLFRVDSGGFTARAALDALGLGFFSIGVGFGLMITYASYAGGIGLRQVAVVTVVADTAISLLAGFAVFPLVFAHGLDPASGPGLVFVTLPIAFARMPLGGLAAVTFFVLLFVAALASAISMLELVVAYAARRLAWTRARASAALAAACFVAGLATVFSFNVLSDLRPTPYQLIDAVTSNYMLPLVGLAFSLFAGRVLPDAVLRKALDLGPRGASLLRVLLRWVTPLLIAVATAAPFFS